MAHRYSPTFWHKSSTSAYGHSFTQHSHRTHGGFRTYPQILLGENAGFSFGEIIAGLVAARLERRVRTLVLLGAGGLALAGAPTLQLLQIRSNMASADIERVHRENLTILMIADPQKVDELAVFLQTDNIRRARFKSGTIPASDILLRALPAVRARITAISGGCDAIMGSLLSEYRRVLASIHRDLDFHVIVGAGHWVIYEAADEVNALPCDMLRANPWTREMR